ncbi:GNAT family N-acetyltransferase [Psychrobacillus sp. FSL K6-1464]|uniref:GNAT family N-acetyltransferase n=1 Tax=Psychrobacillus sp. FSL K6-1464 TaxID=2921545 RepID=UPI0030F716CB
MEKVEIRLAEQKDAVNMLEIQRAVLSEEQYLLSTSEEFNQSVDGQKAWIQSKIDNGRETILVAEIENVVVGWLVFQSSNRKRLSHTGSLGMMIDSAFRGKGIGKALLQELLNWAEQNRYIEKVSLGVFSTNINAISLYKKMGFIEEGRKIGEVKLNDNEYIDDVLMYKNVKN